MRRDTGPPTRRGPGSEPRDLHNNAQTTTSTGTRVTAVDAVVQIGEARIWLEAASTTLSAGLLGMDGITLVEAAEHALKLEARAIRCLELAVVS
jgi:hypothetical protein